MKILYISVHAILEYDEIKLFSELGHDVFSAGAYANPAGHASLPRPALPQLRYYPELERAASTINATGGAIPQELIEWADCIIFMHQPEILQKNWEKLKHKKVIFRSIGQCVSHQELMLQSLKAQGLLIVRYSPKERMMTNYAGEDDLIRFYKDPDEYKGYEGEFAQVINITQSIKQRGDFCYYSEIDAVMKDFPHKYYGIGNEELGEENGGELSYDGLKTVLRNSRCFLYGGTYPACYTLSFIEAWMTGIPVIALGGRFTRERFDHLNYYEIPDLIDNGLNGFFSDSIEELRAVVLQLLENESIAKFVGANGRARAIEIFGKQKISQQWRAFLQSVSEA